ncbi:MAG: AlpA family transcriptional regulator [Nitrospirales bacterium]
MSATIPTSTPASILRLKDLQQRVKLSRSTIYAKIAAGDFPSPITLGPRAVGWLESDIQKWITSRILKKVRG